VGVDWGTFKEALEAWLNKLPAPTTLLSECKFQDAVNGLTDALQYTMCKSVPKMHPSPYSKWWWSKALLALKKKKNKLSAISYKFHAMLDLLSHNEH